MSLQPNQDSTQFLHGTDGARIAYRRVRGEGPTVLWLGGFKSDMTGSKAEALAQAARAEGWDFLRFDYAAHGESPGKWEDARIGHWRQNVLDVVDNLTEGPLIVIGSSMGGWMAALLIRDRPERVQAAVFIAPAPDFATELMLPSLSPEDRRSLEVSGFFHLRGYDYDVPMSQAFFDEARDHRVLDQPLVFDGPVRILHGLEDEVVPWEHGLRLARHIASKDLTVNLIKGSDHRLSGPADLKRLIQTVSALRAAHTT
ncbi:carboxylesterase [Asticcacaulis sp. AND118]|uniref:alpha/beta hydrolase n=1 Tax=Asticcacaulis sp. AND118 TaxID=2840468 RepID=UPI001CFFB249|nr:alpha/beta hydrolase [Asticcacaulis sp. AND118]UDF05411.1 alpha/beta hydrolase [Asticcacaulis sp. AND118]